MITSVRRNIGVAAATGALILGGLTVNNLATASAAAGPDALAWAQAQQAACQAALDHGGMSTAQKGRMLNCVADARTEILALTPVPPSPTPSATPTSAAPSPSDTPVPSPSDTASPSPTPTGAFPDASNTGFGSTVLSPYTGPCTITTPNTQITAKTVNCDLHITTSGVMITKSLINGSVGDDENDAHSFTITDSEVNAGTETNPAVWHTHFTVLRSNIHGGQTAVGCVDLCVVKDSWLHGQVHNPGVANQHFGGFLSNGGGSAATPSLIQHNTIACDVPESTVGGGTSSCSGDVNLYGDFGGVKYYSFINNLLVAPTDSSQGTPSFCAYGGTGKAGLPDHIVYQDNVFMRGLPGNGGDRHCGWWGAATNFDVNAPGDVWSGNHYDDGVVIPAPGP